MFVYLPKGLEKGAEPPPPPPAEVPRTPSDEERSQSVQLEIQGLNVSQVMSIFFLYNDLFTASAGVTRLNFWDTETVVITILSMLKNI